VSLLALDETRLIGRAWRSGLGTKARYGKLLREGDGVFTRSAGGGRVVETGKYWLEVSNGVYAFGRADGVGFQCRQVSDQTSR
jgi:hypothetical protein